MIPRSGPDSWTASPPASSRSSTATAGPPRRRWPRGNSTRPALILALAAALAGPGCAYLNTFYNAQNAFDEGVRLKADADSLTPEARARFERAAEKSVTVLSRHGDSRYADDAMLLLARSLDELDRPADAAAAFERLLERFPDSEYAWEAQLGLARARRLSGEPGRARTAIAPLLGGADGSNRPEVIHEHALIAVDEGAEEVAVEAFRRIQREFPEYATRESVALGFADAELAAGRHDFALEAYAGYRDAASDPAERRRADLRFASALAAAGRSGDALAAYDSVLGSGPPDTLAARVHTLRGALLEAAADWETADAAYRRVAELAPGTVLASRGTWRRGWIQWRVLGEREVALETMLDAFLHAPMSATGDSARTASRRIARILHYEAIAEGRAEVTTLEDPALARSTALYRMAEEVMDAEEAPGDAAAAFERLTRQYPESPWVPKALLAVGLLRRRAGEPGGEAFLREVVERFPDTPAADSARRALDLPVPERPDQFYQSTDLLGALARALPRPPDPMIAIVDQMDRYTRLRQAAATSSSPTAEPAAARPATPVVADTPEPDEPAEREPGVPQGVVP